MFKANITKNLIKLSTGDMLAPMCQHVSVSPQIYCVLIATALYTHHLVEIQTENGAASQQQVVALMGACCLMHL